MQTLTRQITCLLLLSLILSGCSLPFANQPGTTPAVPTTPIPAPRNTPRPGEPTGLPAPYLPTATLPAAAPAVAGHFENSELGLTFTYPPDWEDLNSNDDPAMVAFYSKPDQSLFLIVLQGPYATGQRLEAAATKTHESFLGYYSEVKILKRGAISLANGQAAWQSEFTAFYDTSIPIQGQITSTARDSLLVTLITYGIDTVFANEYAAMEATRSSLQLSAPLLYGIPQDQAYITAGGESTNPRDYDPATGGGSDLVFSGLVMFTPQLTVAPDLAAGWEISSDGTVYTFFIRPNARFHSGRAVTAQDVVYTWERAASPEIDSDEVLTYLGDIVGIADRRAGKTAHISGLKVLDDRTLQVTIDAPKPYFLMKLTYKVASIVDRANVEAGSEWYRTPNGTGPYRLIRWEPLTVAIYERFSDFYLAPPAIRYVIVKIYAGSSLRLYETGGIDITGVGGNDLERMRDPNEPMSADLREGVSMCTSYVLFDTTQAPFNDPKVRQAFAFAVDKQRYQAVVLQQDAITAHGLYPPALPGYNPALEGITFDAARAQQLLAESTYGSADKLPPIVLTTSGLGSSIDASISALAQLWELYLGVKIQVEKIEPNYYSDLVYDGKHGQLLSWGWCADYPDPENFADVLFHTGTEQNLGKYSNPTLDTLLEQARIERDTTKRVAMYQHAEQIIVADAAAIFLSHSRSALLVKPRIKGYVLSPISVPIERYLALQ